jgi:hypothetical protein
MWEYIFVTACVIESIFNHTVNFHYILNKCYETPKDPEELEIINEN